MNMTYWLYFLNLLSLEMGFIAIRSWTVWSIASIRVGTVPITIIMRVLLFLLLMVLIRSLSMNTYTLMPSFPALHCNLI